MMLKIVAGCIFAFLIILTSCICMLLKIPIQPSFLWPLIALACGFAGISSFDFKQFRTTDYGAIERKGEADAKVAAATKATLPTPVVPPQAPAVEIHS